MTFGPDRSRIQTAWGTASHSHKKASPGERARMHRVHNEKMNSVAGVNLKISTTSSRAVQFPVNKRKIKKTNSPKETPKPTKKRIGRNPPCLATSTARPRERPAVPPPKAGVWNKRAASRTVTTQFKRFYDRGDLPLCIGHGAKRKVQWKVHVDTLDYHHHLPLFFEGLRETQEPYTFLAHAGVVDLLDKGGDKVLPVVPQLVLPIKKALDTKNRQTICKVLQVIQHLVKSSPNVGEALVPYYRQILPTFNLVLLLDKRSNLGDQIDYGQQKRENLIDLVNETLEILEQTGGVDAYINLKYLVPTYESTLALSQ